MTTAAFISIKSNSERVKGKNFLKLGDKKLYEHIISNCIAAKCFNDIYVDTDSDEIKDYCNNRGVLTIDREPALTSNSTNGNDLLTSQKEKFPNYDLYFQLHATSPFLKSETIASCVRKLQQAEVLVAKRKHDSIVAVTKEFGWFWFADVPVNFRPGILPRSQDSIPVIKETNGLYGITKKALDKYHCRIGANPYFYEVSEAESMDIDTPEDFMKAEELYRRLQNCFVAKTSEDFFPRWDDGGKEAVKNRGAVN